MVEDLAAQIKARDVAHVAIPCACSATILLRSVHTLATSQNVRLLHWVTLLDDKDYYGNKRLGLLVNY